MRSSISIVLSLTMLLTHRALRGAKVFAEALRARSLYRLTMAGVTLCTTVIVPIHLNAHDDGRFANSPLKEWFDGLGSRNGLCCAFADGFSLQDVDWDTQDGRYRVRIQGEWLVVPDDAVVTEPNRFGSAVVWPEPGRFGKTRIRCFMPGAGT